MEMQYNGYSSSAAASSSAGPPRQEAAEHVDFDEQDQLEIGETSALNGLSKKRKITRTRPLRSCVSCNRRKIKCDRLENGTGGCTPCIRRGEGDSCSLASGTNHPFQSTASILYRLDRLEARVEELEGGSPSRDLQPKLEEGASIDGSDHNMRYSTRLASSSRQPDVYPEYIAPSHGSSARAPQSSLDNSKTTLNSSLAAVMNEPQPKEPDMTADLQGTACDTEEAAQVLENMYASRKVHAASTCPTPSSMASSTDDRSRNSTILIGAHLQADTYAAARSRDIRMRVLNSSSFPTRELADHLVKVYFAYLDVYWHVHINYLFEAEYASFWSMLEAGRHAEVDPAWIAIFLLTLSLGLQVSPMPLPAHCLPKKSMSVEDTLALSIGWEDDVEELLKAADWSKRPQFRVLQTIILLCGHKTLYEFREGSGVTWVGAGIRIAQQMGLHLLGDDCKMPDDDPALPIGSNNVKIQFGRRTWLSLLVLEGVYALQMGRNLPLASANSTSLLPANVDDIDLQSPGELKEKPSWKPTNATSLLHRWILNKANKDLMDLPVDMPTHEKYTHVLALDAELRKWISDAPTASDHRSDGSSYQNAVWRQWSAVTELHGQLMHIHRPYMVRGYTDERYAYSVRVCLESAKVVCEARQHLKESLVDERFWWSSMRWLTAAIVIFIDLYQAIDAGYGDDILELKKAEIPGIYEILKARQSSLYATTRTFAYSATGVIDNLLEAEKVKRSAASSRRNSLGGDTKEVEPVGATFRRIAENLSSTEAAQNQPDSRAEGGNASSDAPQGQIMPKGTPPFASLPDLMVHKPSQVPLKRKAVRAGPPPDQQNYRQTPPATANGVQIVQRAASIASLPGQTLNGSPNTRIRTPGSSMPSILPPHTIPHTIQTFSHLLHPQAPPQQQEQQLVQTQDQQILGELAAGQTISFGPAPISWDTAEMFHPDPSALLHSMGYSYPTASAAAQLLGAGGQISPDLTSLQATGGVQNLQREWDFSMQTQRPVLDGQGPATLYGGTGLEQHPHWYGYAAAQPHQHPHHR